MELEQSARCSDLSRNEEGLIALGKPLFVIYRMRPDAGNS